MNKAEIVFEKLAKEKGKTYKDALTGAAAGTTATLATMPLEIIQIQQSTGPLKGKSFLNVAKNIYAKEGIRGFYTGTGTKLLKVAPTTAITFAAYELLKSHLGK
jgi:hypothetical protein